MAARRRHPTWRGLGVLYRSSPGAVVALLVTQAIDGVAPAVVVAASASLLDHAPGAETSPAARRAVAVALAVVAVTLVLSRVARAVVSLRALRGALRAPGTAIRVSRWRAWRVTLVLAFRAWPPVQSAASPWWCSPWASSSLIGGEWSKRAATRS